MSMLEIASEVQGADPLATVTARQLTEDLRVAMRDVQETIGVLACRVRAAHDARVWSALGYSGWAEYTKQEFGISRAHAYRLLHFARAAAALTAGVAAAGVWSPDEKPIGSRILDFGLSGRALGEVEEQADALATTITKQLQEAHQKGPVDYATVEAIVQGVVREARRPSAPRPVTPAPSLLSDDAPGVERAPLLADHLSTIAEQLGSAILEVAPAYLSDLQAAEIVEATFGPRIGTDTALAARRYAITQDQRALTGTFR
ncbi:hypothetical protein [Streptomyces eurythermus]|uniref:hypothetical protein n=1 Tax=Streptomyces eurythermus TaxID=42237 RepID=UPI003406F212